MTRIGREAVADALRDRIVNALHVGRYTGGDRLPSTRELATEFGVNARVVLAALQILADEGFVVLRPRSGAFVGQLHSTGETQLPDLATWLVNVLLQARARGLSPRAVPGHMQRSLAHRHVRAACIECNADQLHLLCTELADDHGFMTKSVEVAELDRGLEHPALRRADVLVTTVYHSAAVQRAAERLGKPWITVTLRTELMETVAAELQAGPVFYVATDPRFEPKLRRMLAPLTSLRNLRVLLVGRDDLGIIPPDAACFVMTSARGEIARQYGESGGPGRPIHPPRQFSEASARELLTFLVRANGAMRGRASSPRG